MVHRWLLKTAYTIPLSNETLDQAEKIQVIASSGVLHLCAPIYHLQINLRPDRLEFIYICPCVHQ